MGGSFMIKAIVVAKEYRQFATYVRNRRLNRAEYGCFNWNHPENIRGLDKKNVKVLWLEGWSDGTSGYNPEYIKKGINELKTFTNHTEVSEGWIYNESSFV